ncbi:hypothetical protein HCH_01672 [Hahella chejuensis KCTC 2396]|uniref:Uncharacterized protein n=1 Tax=Hahella chejuensis (strain KCTC 2396) TaxID=349521 RepID=Q2SLE9_HAHCH|nr:hypothetical protein [Hahella chejuensis]ABC28525.1 hypothetical protein HCH_01672 [Hahella chejuensis KCTC 2396]
MNLYEQYLAPWLTDWTDWALLACGVYTVIFGMFEMFWRRTRAYDYLSTANFVLLLLLQFLLPVMAVWGAEFVQPGLVFMAIYTALFFISTSHVNEGGIAFMIHLQLLMVILPLAILIRVIRFIWMLF